jgi:hypothetical protein
MKSALTSYKTTAAGAALILGAAADVLTQLSTGNWDMVRLQADGLALVTGAGLIVAKDSNK